MSNLALTELLASYVPKLIQNRVIANPSPIESPVAEELQAAILFADISGFTLLTERMAEKGPTGVETLARILNELKTERAQAAVDNQRTVSLFADALSAASFDSVKASEGLRLRVQSAEKLREAVLQALERTHAILNPQQREKLAYLLRSGALTI